MMKLRQSSLYPINSYRKYQRHIPTVLYAWTTGTWPVQTELIYWLLIHSEQLVVKHLVQGHLDHRLQENHSLKKRGGEV